MTLTKTAQTCWSMHSLMTGLFLLVVCVRNTFSQGPTIPASLAEWADGPRVQIVVDLMHRNAGEMQVSAWYTGFDGHSLCLQQMGNDPEYRYRSLRFFDAGGHTLSYATRKDGHCLDAVAKGPVLARYTVQPGGKGRHGHQGIVLKEWVAFDGRAFLLPKSRVGLRVARMRFETPEDWSVASPFIEKDGWYEVGGYRAALTAQMLGGSCIAVGPFKSAARTSAPPSIGVLLR